MIGGGVESDRVYHLSHASVAATSTIFFPFQWHCRLGHPSLTKLKKIESFSESVSNFSCDVYQLGKHHCVYFPLRFENKSTSLFSYFILMFGDHVMLLLLVV